MEQIIELGHDPFGQRFDDRSYIGDIRQRQREIQFVTADGQNVDLPAESELSDLNFKEWLKEQGTGSLTGPDVRAAGRIMLQRDTGKLQFINIEDWTGGIQLFVGKKQVGDDNWQLIKCLDLGDLIGVDGQLRRTQTGELSIFASKIHILCKTLEQPPGR